MDKKEVDQIMLNENNESLIFPTETIDSGTQTPSEDYDVIQFPSSAIECHVEEKQPEVKNQPPLDFSKFPRVHNREEARAFTKLLRKSGKTDDEITNIIELSKALAKSFEAESNIQYKQSLNEGDIVKLDIDKMRNNPNWSNLQEAYKEYVNANIDTIFSVRLIDKFQGKNTSVFFPSGKTGCARPTSFGDNIVNLADENDKISPWYFNADDLFVYDKKDNTFKAMWLIEEETS